MATWQDVLAKGDIIAHDDVIGVAVTYSKKSGFNKWRYFPNGEFFHAGRFRADREIDRTRTAVAVAKKKLKQLRKESGLNIDVKMKRKGK
jgi:hypothetical protein